MFKLLRVKKKKVKGDDEIESGECGGGWGREIGVGVGKNKKGYYSQKLSVLQIKVTPRALYIQINLVNKLQISNN